MWSGKDSTLCIVDFPEIGKDIFESYRNSHTVDLDIDEEEMNKEEMNKEEKYQVLEVKRNNGPKIPDNISLHDYQIQAIEEWEKEIIKGYLIWQQVLEKHIQD
ncbi:hypothetical protein KEH51_00860 [[Brevibacterium] frigoritolerans]|uniref:Uncharacterized protein n=1 Tax=Peribacillus frigoritolerans TaxID=450367 RepID=A0A941J9J3_9BACI|nr:hypothetical protein [Peribacillus frigoritolerans]